MLKFFKVNDPYRLVGIFVLLVIFRLPHWIYGPDLMVPELKWMLVGERMSAGFEMYYEIWDYISPLSASVYWILEIVFDRSAVVYQIIALLVAFFQVVIFNMIAYRNKFFPQNGYIPALIYAVLISFSVDFLTLSPMLMGITFVLLAFNNIISQIEFRAKRDEKLLSIGLYLGIAGLFHFPLIVLGPIMILVLLLFSSTITRRFFLILYGWCVPLIFTLIFYFYNDTLFFLWLNHITAWFKLSHLNVVPPYQVLVSVSPILAFTLFSIIRIVKKAKLTNYQTRLIQVMFFSFLLTFIILFLEIDRYLFVFIAFIPWLAYFISFYFILAKKGWFAEFMFVIFLVTVIGNNWYSQQGRNDIMDMSAYYLPNQDQETANEKVAVLNDNILPYITNRPATPYINWRLSNTAWKNLNRYPFLSLSVNSILREEPVLIIDPNGIFDNLLHRAPILNKKYHKVEGGFRLNN